MIILSFSNIITKVKKFDIKIEIGTGDVEYTYYPKLTKFGTFKIGSRDDDETVMFPGSFDLKFAILPCENYDSELSGLRPTTAEADSIFHEIRKLIKIETITLTIYNAGTTDIFFSASIAVVSNDMITGDYYRREIGLTFFDDFAALNWSNLQYRHPSDGNYYAWPEDEGILTLKTISDYLKRLLQKADLELVFKTDFRFTYWDNPSSSEKYCYMQDVGAYNAQLYYGNTLGQSLKALLNNFISRGVIGLDRKFYFIPRYYDGSTVRNISKVNIVGLGLSFKISRKYNGLRVKAFYVDNNGNGKYNSIPMGDVRGNEENDSDTVKKMPIKFCVGGNSGLNTDSNGHEKYLVKVSGTDWAQYLVADKVSYKMADGTWSDEHALVDWVSSITWDILSTSGEVMTAELPGVDYLFTDYFQIEGGAKIYQAKNMEINYNKNSTTIDLIECCNTDILNAQTADIKFTKLIEDLGAYYEIDGTRYDGDANAVKISSLSLFYIKVKNPHGATADTATIYDGTVINIPNSQMSAWNDIKQIVVYIFMSTNGLPPEHNYPSAADANGIWYYYTSTFLDDNNIDPDYYYPIKIERVVSSGNVWFWTGYLSPDAKLIDGIFAYLPLTVTWHYPDKFTPTPGQLMQ